MARIEPRDKLDQLIKEHGESYASISRLLGRNSSYIQQFVKRGSPVRLDDSDTAQLSLYFNVSAREFGGSDRPTKGRYSTVTIPVIGLEGRKGATDRPRAVDENWLRNLSDNPAGVAIVIVDGDAMHPTLRDGDEVLIQRGKAHETLRDGLYAIRGSSKTLVRRLALEPTKDRISVLTDHPSFPSWTGLQRRGVKVLGRVIWIGVRLR